VTARFAPTSPRLTGAGLVVLASACFGTLGPLSRFAGDAGVGSLALVAWRAALGGMCMVVFIAVRMAVGHRPMLRLRELTPRERRTLLAAGIANTALNLSVFLAWTRVSIALALLVFYLYPSLVAVASVAWFGERLDRLRWGALLTSVVGMVLVVAGGASLGQLDLLGVGLAFFGAVAQAFYVLAARHGFGRVPGGQAAAATMLLAAGLYVVTALVIGQVAVLGQPAASMAALWPILLAGIIGAGIPTVAFITGIRLLGAPRAAILATLEPVVGVTLAAVLLGEMPQPVQVLGGILIIASGVLLQLRAPDELAEHEAVPIVE
jgi:drug/metabolite transporter (DMT)-like permease